MGEDAKTNEDAETEEKEKQIEIRYGKWRITRW